MHSVKGLVGVLFVVSVLAQYAAQAGAQGRQHSGSDKTSVLPACQGVDSLPSPDCGRTPTPAVGPSGRLWLVFVRHGHVYVTHSVNGEGDFVAPVVVNAVPEVIYSDGENRPRIAFGQQGEVYVSWTHKTPGRYTGDIRFARSLNDRLDFEPPITVNDDRQLISHRFNAMAVDSLGRIHMVWLDKRDKAAAKAKGQDYRGAALYYAVSEDRGKHFLFNRNVADYTCECCRIAIEPDSRNDLVVFWRHIFEGSIRDHGISRLTTKASASANTMMRATFDDWVMDGCPHQGPDLSLGGDDSAHLVWFSGGGKRRGLSYGRFDLAGQSLAHAFLLDGTSGASRPQVLAVSGTVYATWKAFDGQRTSLVWRVSRDDGKAWSEPHILAQTATKSDHPMLIEFRDSVYVSWHTDGEGYRLMEVSAQ